MTAPGGGISRQGRRRDGRISLLGRIRHRGRFTCTHTPFSSPLWYPSHHPQCKHHAEVWKPYWPMHALGMSKSSFFGLHLVPTAAVLKVGSRLPVAALSNAQGWLKAACSSLEPAWLKAACSNLEPFAQGCAGPSHEILNPEDSYRHSYSLYMDIYIQKIAVYRKYKGSCNYLQR